MNSNSNLWDKLARRGDLLFSVALLSVVFILVLPLPPVGIDIFISISIALSVLIILAVAYIRDPTDFFVFPTILLFVTLFRLGLNIATTRAILSTGDAGHLINTFGEVLIRRNLLVGLIVFSILTIINFIVITKGAGRVAEVSARFTLDAMPGKQMSVDADLNAGIISEQDARARREKLERDASFYGAMDGASKFVRGDAVAGILITGINLAGGFAVGILQMGLTASQAVSKFCLLSVGDGLVSQIPALLISTAAGILVTRSSSRNGLGEDVARQLFNSSRSVTATAVLLWLMMLIPGFPKVVLFLLGSLFFSLSRILPREPEGVKNVAPGARLQEAKNPTSGPATRMNHEPEEASFRTEPLVLELGLNLLTLARGGVQNLLDRLGSLRRGLSAELGIPIPPISVRANASLPPSHYRLLLRGHEIAKGELYPGQLLAMGASENSRPLRGHATHEPTFGLPAVWISETDRREAERMGYAVVDSMAVLSTHVSESLKSVSADMLARQDVQKMLDRFKESHPAVLQEMNTLQVNLGTVHRVLQNLLREGVPVRDLSLILEKLCDHSVHTKNHDELGEACRKALRLEITRQRELKDGKLPAITLHPDIEQQLVKSVRQTPQEIAMVLEPGLARHLYNGLSSGIREITRHGTPPLLLCSPTVRLGLKRFFGETFPNLQVCAYNEISSRIPIHSVFTILPVQVEQTVPSAA